MNDADAPDSCSALSLKELNRLLVSNPVRVGPRTFISDQCSFSILATDFWSIDRVVRSSKGLPPSGYEIADCYWEMRRAMELIVSAESVGIASTPS
jgi:hypothetical protein